MHWNCDGSCDENWYEELYNDWKDDSYKYWHDDCDDDCDWEWYEDWYKKWS